MHLRCGDTSGRTPAQQMQREQPKEEHSVVFSPRASFMLPRAEFPCSSSSLSPVTSIPIKCRSSWDLSNSSSVRRSSSGHPLRVNAGSLNSSFLQRGELGSSTSIPVRAVTGSPRRLDCSDIMSLSTECLHRATKCASTDVISPTKYSWCAVTPLQGILKCSNRPGSGTTPRSRRRRVHFDKQFHEESGMEHGVILKENDFNFSRCGLSRKEKEASLDLRLGRKLRCPVAWGEDSQWFNEQFGLEPSRPVNEKNSTATSITGSSSSRKMGDENRPGKLKQPAEARVPLKEPDLIFPGHRLESRNAIFKFPGVEGMLQRKSSRDEGSLSLRRMVMPGVPSNDVWPHINIV